MFHIVQVITKDNNANIIYENLYEGYSLIIKNYRQCRYYYYTSKETRVTAILVKLLALKITYGMYIVGDSIPIKFIKEELIVLSNKEGKKKEYKKQILIIIFLLEVITFILDFYKGITYFTFFSNTLFQF